MVGYVLAREAWGRGIATEALAAMTTLADQHGITHLYAYAHPGHTATHRVLAKGGYELNAVFVPARFPNLDDLAFAHKYLRPPVLALERLTNRDDVEACADRCRVDVAHQLADELHLAPASFEIADALRFADRFEQSFRQPELRELVVVQFDQ